MAYSVVVTRSAQDDLDAILSYVITELCNPSAAALLLDEVERHYDILSNTPLIYAECVQPLLRASHYRKIVLAGYLMIYRVDTERKIVYVERFFSGLQDYEKKL